MSTTDFYADLIRRAEACERGYDAKSSATVASRCHGGAAAYRHAAELLRGAVAAAVEEEREANVATLRAIRERMTATGDALGETPDGYDAHTRAEGAQECEDAIRARGESPRGDAASDGREGAE